MVRWNANSKDAEDVREIFAKGRFDPKNYKSEDIRDKRTDWLTKYKADNFRKNARKIASEFTRPGRIEDEVQDRGKFKQYTNYIK